MEALKKICYIFAFPYISVCISERLDINSENNNEDNSTFIKIMSGVHVNSMIRTWLRPFRPFLDLYTKRLWTKRASYTLLHFSATCH